MNIEFALIADFAEIANGKLYLMGGGWDVFNAQELPVPVRMAIVVGVRIDWDETNQPVPIVIRVEDEDGREFVKVEGAVNVGRPPDLAPGSGQLAQVAANVPLSLPNFGGYRVHVRAGEDGPHQATRALPFRVVQRPA